MEFPDKSPSPQQYPTPGAVPEKNIKPVVTGVIQVKRPASRRFLEFVFAESPKDLGKKIGRELVVPRIKDGFETAFNAFLHGMLWGANKPMGNFVQNQAMRGGGINYNGIPLTATPVTMAIQAAPPTSSSGYQDLQCQTQQQAEILLTNMYELLNRYRVVTVADLYELAGRTTAVSDHSYGWTSLDSAQIRPNGPGFLLSLPKPTLI